MSVTQLDDLMSLMVKSASNSDASGSRVSKTNWWPRELALTNPVLARHTSAVDAPNWRETLNSFVTKYSTLQKTVRGCKVLPSIPSMNNVRRRRAQPRHSRNKANGDQHRKGEAAATSRLGEMKLEIRPNGNVGPKYSPVVSLCDILKLNPNDKVKNKDKSPPLLGKDQFLNYFDLASNTESSCTLVDKGEVNKYTTSHPKTLVNCPHVPFSSDLGIKLTKDWHVIPPETHVKKLERLERYIRPNLFNIRHATDCSYEISYNKNTDFNHIYKFPSKTHRRKGKLSQKSRFLLKHYCKPCTVNLTKLENMLIRLNSVPSEVTSNKLVILNEKNNQKENVQQKVGVHMEARVVLTDKLKENAHLYKPLSGNTVTRPLPSHTNAVPKSHVSSSNLSMHQQPAGRLQNTVLKTLSPRNENAVGTTMDIKKPVELLAKCKNLINASVILTPINFFELQTSVLESGKTRSEGVEASTEKRDSKKNKINKIGKKRVNICYPRRISPRLNIVASTSPVKVM